MDSLAPVALGFFAVLLRVGTAIMLLPGFASFQVPIQVRLAIAIAISFSVFVMIANSIGDAFVSLPDDPASLLVLFLGEAAIGALLAVPVRLLFLSLGFMGEVITNMIGLNPIPGTPLGDTQAGTTISNLMNIAAVVLFFAGGVHISFVLALSYSFTELPVGSVLSIQTFVEQLATDLSGYFDIVLRIAAPLMIYSVILNLVAGLVNKMTPQIPVYFVSTPFLIFGGVFILVVIGDDMLLLFNMEVNRIVNELI